MRRAMIIPAAGTGSRLRSPLPKVLAPVNGRPMLDHLLERYTPFVDRFVLVVHPTAEAAVRRHCAWRGIDADVEIQESPTGMLDAILIPHDRLRRLGPDSVWLTWCDQVAVHPETIRTLASLSQERPAADLIFPTVLRSAPYIHFERGPDGRIIRVLQRREGDAMPERGESDVGLFCMSPSAYLDRLHAYSREAVLGKGTGERNFLTFVPWFGSSDRIRTFEAREAMESVGVNTPAELAEVEAYLLQESRRGASLA